MNSDRIREIQSKTTYPDSISVQQALLQVWNECQQEYENNLSFIIIKEDKFRSKHKGVNEDYDKVRVTLDLPINVWKQLKARATLDKEN